MDSPCSHPFTKTRHGMPDIKFDFDGPRKAPLTIALAPASGQSLKVEFMAHFAEALGQIGLRVARFNFPYMSERDTTGRRRAPDGEPVLHDTWRQVITQLGAEKLFIGGKSQGGRTAAVVADECGVKGVVCLGFPFHPTAKPDQYDVTPLDTIQTPTLLMQGEWDIFGDKGEVQSYTLSPPVQLKWMKEGDHSFQPPKESKRTREENWNIAARLIGRFIMEVTGIELAVR